MNNEIGDALRAGTMQLRLQAGSEHIELVRIPPGSFILGSPPHERGHRDVESPERKVNISKPFYIGRYELTQSQYRAVTGQSPSPFSGNDLAVDQITHADAREFCTKLTALVGVKVTLPTEAQWEYACRAGTTTRFYTGETEEDLHRAAWFKLNSNGRVHAIGQKEPNAFGLFDMLGNVWEHCLDDLPDYRTISAIDPVGAVAYEEGTMRGGGWMFDAEHCRAACGLRTDDRFGGAGIRIVINPSFQSG